ncbi:PAAR domain-containing protein [Massilia violaceinigra]|uniref:PAAR domain-containing protein n=1 Tax=Massilia violaceinigra TaxID=2045208 RepID=A0ABY4A0I1_9BURK|nr:PAAR domain-containing protein [Massilia violaceinigra]UOD28183.1 PAAR domain-containing protein [Massilia violaceinigra]
MPDVIRLNDPTSHGGTVVSVAMAHLTVAGLPVACVGDKCSCPVHGDTVIVEGNSVHTLNGIAVAYDGNITSCGAILRSTLATFTQRKL